MLDQIPNQVPTHELFILTKDMKISTIVEASERAVELLTEYGLYCTSCFLNQFDNLEMGAEVHGMSQADVDHMIQEINEQLIKEWEERKLKV